MYVRFVVEKPDERSHELQGIFHALGDLSDAGRLASHEQVLHKELRTWFNSHLERPERFARSRRRGAHRAAICWFKASAREHVSRARDLATLLECHDVPVRMVTTRRPGYIVYEDDHQVAAEPFRGERR